MESFYRKEIRIYIFGSGIFKLDNICKVLMGISRIEQYAEHSEKHLGSLGVKS